MTDLNRTHTLQKSHDDLVARLVERDATIADLRDHLSRETKSAEASAAIADELSVALEKSRERVADHESFQVAIREALQTPMGVTSADHGRYLRERVAELEADLRAMCAQVREIAASISDDQPALAGSLQDIASR